MIDSVKSWARENSTLIYFLIAQAIAVISAGAWGLTYMVQLENRVATLETRGSPHLSVIDNRLTVLESTTKENKQRLDHVIDIMTRQLNVKP